MAAPPVSTFASPGRGSGPLVGRRAHAEETEVEEAERRPAAILDVVGVDEHIAAGARERLFHQPAELPRLCGAEVREVLVALPRAETARVSSKPMPFGLGGWEILIFVGVLALLFGSKGLPQVARRLGTGMREVKDAVAEVDPRRMLEAGEDDKPKDATPKAATPQKPAASGDEPPAV